MAASMPLLSVAAMVVLWSGSALCTVQGRPREASSRELTETTGIFKTARLIGAGRSMPRTLGELMTQVEVLRSVLATVPQESQHTILLTDSNPSMVPLVQATAITVWEEGKDLRIAACAQTPDLQELLQPQRLQQRRLSTVVALCSMEDVLYMLKQVADGNLENPWAAWVVVVGGSDELEQLRAVVREGTVVLTLMVGERGRGKVFRSVTAGDGQTIMEVVATWRSSDVTNPAASVLTTTSWLFPTATIALKQDLRGRVLNIAVVDNWPFFGLLEDAEGQLTPDSGIDVSVINTLSAAMNFKYRVVTPDDGQWGGPQPDGSVTGMIGMVANYKADLAIDEITITVVRETVVDFSRPYYLESSAILSRAPGLASMAFAVFSPFTSTVWSIIVTAVVCVGPIMALVAWLIGDEADPQNNAIDPPQGYVFRFCFNAYRSMMIQGNLLAPRKQALRFLFAFWYIFCFIIYALYAGTLTAVFAAPSYERPLDTLSDLLAAARDEGLVPVVTEGSSIHELFMNAEVGMYRDIYRQFIPSHSLAPGPDEGVAQVLSMKSALIEAKLATEIRATMLGRHLFHLGRQSFYPQAYGIACHRGAPYLHAINRLLSRMVEAGLIDIWKRRELRLVATRISSSKDGGDKKEDAPPQDGIGAITLIHLQGAFFVYMIGMIASTATLLMENVKRKCMT